MLRSSLLLAASLGLAWTAVAAPAIPSGVAMATRAPLERSGDEVVRLPRLDADAIHSLDEQRLASGRPAHFAHAHLIALDPWRHGSWSPASAGRLRWQLRLESPGALSLSLALRRFHLPADARLEIRGGSGRPRLPVLDAGANNTRRELWTAPLASDVLELELEAPADTLADLDFEIFRVHQGYAGFGEQPARRTGACQRDVACAEGDELRAESRSVAQLTVEGVRYCTGFLVNNTAQDGRPLFLTAGHCGIAQGNAQTVVVIWNDERPACGAGESRNAPSRSGATWLARHDRTDMVLLELDRKPDPGWRAVYAGWDRSGEEPTRGAAIHHPNSDSRRIAVALEPLARSAYLGRDDDPEGAFWRVPSWDAGATEGGSSGAPFFNQNRLAIGLLRGGYASCTERAPDYFGRLDLAWDGRSARQRLRDWLDPLGTGTLRLPSFDPNPSP
jgi:hypothetical protein